MKRILAVVLAALITLTGYAQTNVKISQLPAGAPAQGADLVPVARGSANYSLKVSDIVSFFGGYSVSAPLVLTGTNISIPAASASASGFLGSTDWNTFNSKQSAIGFVPLNPANNLSDLSSASTGRTNLGLGTAATQAIGAFDPSGAAAAETTRAEAAEALLAPKASPTFTGIVTAPQYCLAGVCITAWPSGGGAVSSVFGRTGTVVAQNADYSSYYDATGAASAALVTAESFTTAQVNTETTRAEAAEALLLPKASPTFTTSITGPQYCIAASCITVWPSPGAVTSLTTTGTGGAATLSGGVLNIPQYAGGSGMVWPSAVGVPYWTSGTAWGGSYSNTNPIPANYVANIPESQITNLVSNLSALAPLASPVFTGSVTSPQFCISASCITSWPSVPVTSVFGRTGAVVAASGDYSAYYDATGAAAAETTRAEAAEALLAPKASPAFTGTPTAPNVTAGDNTTKIANTAFVTAAIAAAPGGISSVTAGTDLTGGGTSGAVTLNLDTTKVPQLATANTFTADQTINGNLFLSGNVTQTGTGPTQWSGNEWTGSTVTVPSGLNFSIGVNNSGVFSCYLTSGTSCMPSGGAVSSVFGRTGAVVATSGDYSAYYDATGAAAAETTRAEAAEALLAPVASPSFTTKVTSPQFCISASCITVWPGALPSEVDNSVLLGISGAWATAAVASASGSNSALTFNTSTHAFGQLQHIDVGEAVGTGKTVSYNVAAGDDQSVVFTSSAATGAITYSLSAPTGSSGNFRSGYKVTLFNNSTYADSITASGSTLYGLSSLAPGASLDLRTDGTNWYALAGSGTAAPGTTTTFLSMGPNPTALTSAAVIFGPTPVPQAITVPANGANGTGTSQFILGTLPTASWVGTLYHINASTAGCTGTAASMGTVTISTTGAQTWALTATSFAIGDCLKVVAPSTIDTTAANPTLSLVVVK